MTFNTLDIDGVEYAWEARPDDTMGAPWSEHDGHGPVSDWRRASWRGYIPKAPGERVLHEDRGAARVYDFAAAVKLAKTDGWLSAAAIKRHGSAEAARAAETRGQLAAEAAEEDFRRLQRWCGGDWWWVGVVVAPMVDGDPQWDDAASLWGIESDAGAYLETVARELAEELHDCVEAV